MIISATTSKGGAGKTTLMTNLAVFFAEQGLNVFVLDMDPQHSIVKWGSLRPDNGAQYDIGIYGVPPDGDDDQLSQEELAQLINHLYDQHDVLLIDVPGVDDYRLRTAMAVCDVALIPVEVGGFNLFAAQEVVEVMAELITVRTEPLLGAVVLNRTDRSGTNCLITRTHRKQLLGRLEEIQEEYGVHIPIMERGLSQLNNFGWAASNGLGVLEYDPGDKSAHIVTELGREVISLCQQFAQGE